MNPYEAEEFQDILNSKEQRDIIINDINLVSEPFKELFKECWELMNNNQDAELRISNDLGMLMIGDFTPSFSE